MTTRKSWAPSSSETFSATTMPTRATQVLVLSFSLFLSFAPALWLSLIFDVLTLSVAANTKVFTLGRHRTNDVQLEDIVASKFHARITWQNVYWQNFFWLQASAPTFTPF